MTNNLFFDLAIVLLIIPSLTNNAKKIWLVVACFFPVSSASVVCFHLLLFFFLLFCFLALVGCLGLVRVLSLIETLAYGSEPIFFIVSVVLLVCDLEVVFLFCAAAIS